MRYIWEKLFSLKLRTKFMLSFVLIILIMVPMIATVIYKVSVHTIKGNTASNSHFLIGQIGINLDKRTTDIEELAFEQFRNSNLEPLLAQRGDDGIGDVLRSKEIANYLSNLLYSREYFRNAAYIEPNGNPHQIGRTLDPGTTSIILDPARLEKVKQKRGQALWVPGPGGMVLMAKSLYGLTTGAYAGTVILGVDSGYIESLYTEVNRLTNGNILILNEENQLLSQNGKIPGFAKYFMNKELYNTGENDSFTWNRTNYLYTVLSTSLDKWKIVQIISVAELTRGTAAITYWTVNIIVIALLIASLLAAVLSKSITENVRMLLQSMTNFSVDFSHKVIVPKSRDEVGLLAERFNLMAEKIGELINTVYKEKLLKQKAEYRTLQFEYKALQAQINPHFLYNTLESIYALAKLKGEEQIGELIYLLGSLLRESIGKKGDIILLRDEIDFIRKYLTIHQIIYEDKIEVVYDLDERWMDCPVPKFILQPLVENAIKHGIEEKPGKGIIRIACRCEERDLILEVSDNGVGMDKKTAFHVMNPDASPARPAKDKHTNVGIISVHKRIAILYGDAYGLAVKSVPDEGTTILIRIPITWGEKSDEEDSRGD